MKLRELQDVDLAALVRQAAAFERTPLAEYLCARIQTRIANLLTTLKSKSTPLEDVRYAQGALEQATCDILLVEGLHGDILKEVAKRRKETPES